jgi:hypothetical protein
MRILIVYDGSDACKQAVQSLLGAGLPRLGEAMVLTPVQVWPRLPQSCYRPESPHGGRLLHMAHSLAKIAAAEATATANEGAQRLSFVFPDWHIGAETCLEPLTASVLDAKAEQWGADYLLTNDAGIRRRGEPAHQASASTRRWTLPRQLRLSELWR